MDDKDVLSIASKIGIDYLDTVPSRPIISASSPPSKDPSEIRKRLWKKLTENGVPAGQVIQDLSHDAEPGLINTQSGRYFGFVIGGTFPVAIAADWLTSAYDQNAGASFVSPTGAVLEEVVGIWLKDLLHLPSEATFSFTGGCQMAHITALTVARNYLLSKVGWNVKENGLWGAPRIRVLVGQHHETIKRALWILGVGSNAIEIVKVVEDGTMDVHDLKVKLGESPDQPTLVCLAAGELNTGVFDPVGSISDITKAIVRNAWVHVDGAFGMWAACSEKFQHLTNGMSKADSWATDGHKILQLPQDHGFCFINNPQAHYDAFTIHAAYAPQEIEAATCYENSSGPDNLMYPLEGPIRDQYHYGLEWSRRAKGFVIYATLRHLGRNGLAHMFENLCDQANYLVELLSKIENVQVLAKPIINQGLVRFLDPFSNDHDAYTDHIIRRINSSRVAWFGGTTWKGMRVMRISVCSHLSTRQDMDITFKTIQAVLCEPCSSQPQKLGVKIPSS